jgi:hypothetical protein
MSSSVCWTWNVTPVILALRRLRQEDHQFEANLGYIGRHYLKKQAKTKTKQNAKSNNKRDCVLMSGRSSYWEYRTFNMDTQFLGYHWSNPFPVPLFYHITWPFTQFVDSCYDPPHLSGQIFPDSLIFCNIFAGV